MLRIFIPSTMFCICALVFSTRFTIAFSTGAACLAKLTEKTLLD